jgi:hypothetical protein
MGDSLADSTEGIPVEPAFCFCGDLIGLLW